MTLNSHIIYTVHPWLVSYYSGLQCTSFNFRCRQVVYRNSCDTVPVGFMISKSAVVIFS